MILPIFITAFLYEISSASKNKKKTALKWFTAGALGTAVFLIPLGGYNYLRFGSVFENGYNIASADMFGGIGAFEGNPLYSVSALFFSPGKSLFLYNPVLLLLPFCFLNFYKKNRSVALATFFAVSANLIFNGFHTTWAGDYAWSSRYQASIIPFLILPLACLFEKRSKIVKGISLGIIVISMIIQISSVIYSFHLEFVQNSNHTIIPDSYIWRWDESHLVKRSQIFQTTLKATPT
jgi:hypothetical protein